MAQSYKLIVLSTLYTVLVMILVSLDGTYNVTHFILGGGDDYGVGMSLRSRGFYVHIILFAILIALPMLMCKSYD
jgi:hypothetical protein